MCSSELKLIDLDTGESLRLETTDLIVAESTISFTTAQVTDNRQYNVTVRAGSVSATTSFTTISKHSINFCEQF